jgi:DNA repair protein SbcC/Rad50
VRPLTLTIEGLTSFKTSQEIDLSELDLFVITGPTGSGKSSILDAITFALYGNIPRVTSHELRDLISHGSSYMRVCLDFQVDGTHYRVARRMGKNSHQATLERVDGDSSATEVEQGGIRTVNERLEQVVGLDFKAFTKAVLLPQGAFHEFLQGEVGERRRILMRLLDLGRYEVAGQAARREATRLDAIIGERSSLIESNYADATKDRLVELEAVVTAARDHRRKVEQAKKEAKKIAETASDAERNIAALTQSVSQVETAFADLKRLADAWPPLDAEDRSSREELEQTQKVLEGAQEAVNAARKTVTETTERTGDASRLTRLEGASATRAREQAELEKLDGQLVEARKAAHQLAEALTAADKNAADTQAALEQENKKREAAEGDQTRAEAVLRGAETSASLAGLDTQLTTTSKKADQAHAHAEEVRTALKHLEQQHAAVALRAGLAPGDHCPVCDSVIQAVPDRDGDTDSLLKKAREAVTAAEAQERETKDAVVSLRTRQHDAREALKQARTALPKDAEIPAREDAAVQLAEAQAACATAQAAETSAQAAIAFAVQAASDARTAAKSAATEAGGIAKMRNGAEERLNAALSVLTETFGKKLPEDLQAEIARRRDELSSAEEARQQAEEAAETARTLRDTAQRARTTNTERVAAFDQEAATTRTAARIACEAIAQVLVTTKMPVFPTKEAERPEMLSGSVDCCDEHRKMARAAAKEFRKAVTDTVAKLGRLAAKIGIEVEGEEPAEIAAELEQASTDAHGAAVAAEKDVEELQKRIAEREKLEQEIVDDRHLCALHQALARELRTDHFIAFVLEESMYQLAAQASDQLLLISDGRYSLVADEGSFEVIDHHNADERRSVATLSGGETFLASLSLALALAAGLRELAGTAAGRLEAIFIDEGFGALDPETLDVVVDALERLREGDRMVGVITHVPTLAERIPAGLSVEKDGSSSRILVR